MTGYLTVYKIIQAYETEFPFGTMRRIWNHELNCMINSLAAAWNHKLKDLDPFFMYGSNNLRAAFSQTKFKRIIQVCC